jgi:hypothetical protein
MAVVKEMATILKRKANVSRPATNVGMLKYCHECAINVGMLKYCHGKLVLFDGARVIPLLSTIFQLYRGS